MCRSKEESINSVVVDLGDRYRIPAGVGNSPRLSPAVKGCTWGPIVVRRSFRREVAGWLIVVAAITVLLGMALARASARSTEDVWWVEHTHEVIAALGRLWGSLRDVESGARDYFVSGDKKYLELFDAAWPVVEEEWGDLVRLTAD